MRKAFIDTMLEVAGDDPRLNLVVGDLGYSVVEPFAQRFPDRFLNAGVAEQNMTGLATGLALTGERIVFNYSIANFPVMRCLEQIRNDVCHHQANVKIVAVGGGVAYGAQGFSHHAVEDLAVMRAMPGMVVTAPADAAETRAVTRLACATPGPWYIRLGKNGEPGLHAGSVEFSRVGASIQVCDGRDGTLIATGAVAHEVAEAARQLARRGVHVRMLSMPFVKPIDHQAIRRAASETPWIVTVEEHNPFGGLGSAVADVLTQGPLNARLLRLCYPEFIHETGGQTFLRKQHGLDALGIVDFVQREAVGNW
ncbi:MAG: transketolase [Planctomycetes bacterium]|nr:transketolase [Planctomycetota bacterium]